MLAEVVGKMMKVKELKVAMIVYKLKMYGFKHHPENEARKAHNPDGGWPRWVNGPRFRFYHEDFRSKGNLTSLLRIKQN